MTGVMEWVKNYTMVFLLLSVISAMAAKKDYKRYINFFVELLLVVAIVTPVLQLLGRDEDFFEKISYDSFWQGLDSIRMDQEKMEFLDDSYYINYYEDIIATDVKQMAGNAGFEAADVLVTMTDTYEVEHIYMEVSSSEDNQILVGEIFENEISPEIENLRNEVAEYYQVKPEQIQIAQ